MGGKNKIYPISYQRFFLNSKRDYTGSTKDLEKLNSFMDWLDSLLGTDEEMKLLEENPWLEEFRIDVPEFRCKPRTRPGEVSEIRFLFNKLQFIGIHGLKGDVDDQI